MVIVDFKHKEENNVFSINISGHARNENKGMESACTACSILCYTAGQNLLLLKGEDKLKKKPHIKIDDGRAEIICRPKDEFTDDVVNILNVIYVGYQLLEASYPEFIRVLPFTV